MFIAFALNMCAVINVSCILQQREKGKFFDQTPPSCVSLYILLHVHPLLGNELVNEFPRRQIFGKQSFARLHNNRGDCVFYVVRAKQQYINGVMQSVSKQRNCKHVYNNRCFPWGLCRVLIREVNSDASSVQGSCES
jgi:hypothetical protein